MAKGDNISGNETKLIHAKQATENPDGLDEPAGVFVCDSYGLTIAIETTQKNVFPCLLPYRRLIAFRM